VLMEKFLRTPIPLCAGTVPFGMSLNYHRKREMMPCGQRAGARFLVDGPAVRGKDYVDILFPADGKNHAIR